MKLKLNIIISPIDFKYKILRLLQKILGKKYYFPFLKFIGDRYLKWRISRNYISTNRKYKTSSMIVYMADGKANHGGLSDRLRGMVTLYSYCKEVGVEFKINFQSPFDLSEFLLPNQVNWTIDEHEISYDFRQAEPIVLLSVLGQMDNSDKYLKECKKEKSHVMKKLNSCHKNQKHVYTNIGYDDIHFHELYAELFKPSAKLSDKINENLAAIGTKYISFVFRFQNLLGDFYEGPFPTLNESEKNKLIEKCLSAIERLHQKENSIPRILVTSDSRRFLDIVNSISYCYTIQGEVKHMGFTKDSNSDVYMKSFIDLYMLSLGEKVILAKAPIMYHSGFAKRASLLGNIGYEEYVI